MSRRVQDLGLDAIDNILFDRFVAVQYEGGDNMMSQEARERKIWRVGREISSSH